MFERGKHMPINVSSCRDTYQRLSSVGSSKLHGFDPGNPDGPFRRPAIAGANVSIANVRTNETSMTKSDASGNYIVPNLRPGEYVLTIEAAGFKKFVQDRIPLQIDQRARVDASLVLGSTSEVVEITAAAPVLQTETGSIGQVVDNRKIVGLPLNGRGAFALIGLVPGVADGTSVACLAPRRASTEVAIASMRSNWMELPPSTLRAATLAIRPWWMLSKSSRF